MRHGIAYAGGLAEAGGEGIERQRALAALCRETGFLLCGPNCVGVINTALPATSTFATALHELDALRPGVVSMVSQSGGIGTTSFAMAQQAGFGFRYLISSGNEAVVDFSDYLHALARDDGTEVIVAYLEGVQDGAKLVRALEEARRQRKPVVLIKAGRSPTTARAAEAHTGALVGEERVWNAVLQELGVIRVDSVEELIDTALMLVGNHSRLPAGPGVGIVSFGGGSGVLAADQCTQHGLFAPALSAEGVARLRPMLVSVASAANPLDLTPTTAFRPEALARLPEVLDVIAAEPAIDSLLFIASSLAARATEITGVIGSFSQRSTKPVCVSWSSPPKGVIERLAEHGIHTFIEPDRGTRTLRRLVAHALATRRPQRSAAARARDVRLVAGPGAERAAGRPRAPLPRNPERRRATGRGRHARAGRWRPAARARGDRPAGGDEGHQRRRHPSRRRRSPGGRPALRGGGARGVPRPRGPGARDPGRARGHLRPEDAQGRGRAARLGLPRPAVRHHGLLRQRRRPYGAASTTW